MAIQAPVIPSYVLYGETTTSRFPDCVHCEPISERSRLHDYVIRPHMHRNLVQFLWVAEGAAVMESDGTTRRLDGPSAVMVPPLAVHGFRFDPEIQGVVVSVPADNLTRVVGGVTASRPHGERPVVNVGDGPGQLFNAIADEHGGTQAGRDEALLCLAGLLTLWFRRQEGERSSAVPAAHADLVRRFTALIESEFRRQRPLTWYARELGVTVTHLSRVCRRRAGASALVLVHERLVLEAKRNLAYTPATITEVGEHLGFEDPSYFSKFFAQHAGETPSAFRRSLGN